MVSVLVTFKPPKNVGVHWGHTQSWGGAQNEVCGYCCHIVKRVLAIPLLSYSRIKDMSIVVQPHVTEPPIVSLATVFVMACHHIFSNVTWYPHSVHVLVHVSDSVSCTSLPGGNVCSWGAEDVCNILERTVLLSSMQRREEEEEESHSNIFFLYHCTVHASINLPWIAVLILLCNYGTEKSYISLKRKIKCNWGFQSNSNCNSNCSLGYTFHRKYMLLWSTVDKVASPWGKANAN